MACTLLTCMGASILVMPPWGDLALGLLCFVTRFKPSTMTRWVTRFTDLIMPDLPFSSPAITFTVSPDFTCSCTGSAFLIAMI